VNMVVSYKATKGSMNLSQFSDEEDEKDYKD
jgi:hypothetical protein